MYGELIFLISFESSHKFFQRKACPILFYIHGGSFYYDSAVMFNDTEIIRKYASDELVFIIPAYRPGIFGFLDLGEPLEGAPYNVGIYDMILALRWAQKEASKFGGDATKITLMGNSGGGAAVEYLQACPALESNVFDKVIISSGLATLKPHASFKMTQLTSEVVGV
jgi:carboxylesterase type B